MVRDHSFSTYAKLSGNLKFLTPCKAYSSSLLRAVIASNHLPYFKIFSNFVNVPFATFPFEKITPILLFSRIGPALIRTSTWIRNVSFSENFAYGLNEWSLSSFFLQYNNLRFRKVTTMHLFLKKNLTHVKKVGHTSEFLFGIYWCIWHFFKRNKENTCTYHYRNLDMIYSSWDTEQNILKLVILGHFLPLYTPKKPQNQNFEKWKNLLEISSSYKCVQKSQYMMYGSWDQSQSDTDRIFLSLWAIFCPLPTPPPPPLLMITNIKILKKKFKKMPGDMILLYIHMYHHAIYGSWNIRCNRQKFSSFWGPFFALSDPWKPGKSKYKHWKKHPEILSFYTFAP